MVGKNLLRTGTWGLNLRRKDRKEKHVGGQSSQCVVQWSLANSFGFF